MKNFNQKGYTSDKILNSKLFIYISNKIIQVIVCKNVCKNTAEQLKMSQRGL